MRRYGLLVLSFFFVTVVATTPALADGSVHSLEPGAWALQFQVDENFTLSEFGASTVAAKRQLGRRWASRLGFSVSTSSNELDRDQTVTSTGGQTTTSSFQDRDAWAVGIDLLVLRYAGADDARMHFFWGVGPSFEVGSSEQNSEDFGDARSSTVDEDRWSIGAAAAVGVEWFATTSISLHAEYGIAYARDDIDRSLRSEDASGETVSDESVEQWRLSGSGVCFGLSAYF